MPRETITATVQKVRFCKEESRWHIIKSNKGIIKGVVQFDLKVGDTLQIEGEWKRSKFNGEMEFDFRTAILSIPTDSRALLHYAASITKGIGPAAEDLLWQTYGEDWKDQEAVSQLPGVSEKTDWFWTDTLQRLKTQEWQTQTISFLVSKGCSLNLATAAWVKWEGQTYGMVQANCYCMTDLPHYGFSHIDQGIRQNMGIDDGDPRRLDAAIMYAVGQVVERGNTVVSWEELLRNLDELVPLAHERMEDGIKRLVEADKLHLIELEAEIMVARRQDYLDEEAVWQRFATTAETSEDEVL